MIKRKNNPAKTVLIISVGFSIVFLVFNLKWALTTSVIIGVLGALSNRLSDKIDFLWMKLAKALSFIVPNIILSVVFYLFLFPIALLSKIFGAKTMLQLKNSDKSIWVRTNKKIDKVSFEKMW